MGKVDIKLVQVPGKGWDVKISADGYPVILLCDGRAPYTMAQAQTAGANMRRDIARHGIEHLFRTAKS